MNLSIKFMLGPDIPMGVGDILTDIEDLHNVLVVFFFFRNLSYSSCRITMNIRLIQAYNSDLFDGEPTASKSCNPPKPCPKKQTTSIVYTCSNMRQEILEQLQSLDPKKWKKETNTLLKTNTSPLKNGGFQVRNLQTSIQGCPPIFRCVCCY